MTELKHGSNVAMLQTTATFDVATDEWIITTPNEGASLPPPVSALLMLSPAALLHVSMCPGSTTP